MKYANLIIVALLSLLFVGCEEDSPVIENIGLQTLEYLSFGHIYGFCQGEECIEIFRIDDVGVAEDSKDETPSRTKPYDGNFTYLDGVDRSDMESLITDFPVDLLNEKEAVLGCPDCADQGGYYLEISPIDGTRQFWIVDTNKSSVPDYLHDYMDAIQDAITLIND